MVEAHSDGAALFVSDNLVFDWQFKYYGSPVPGGGTLSDFRAAESAISTPAWLRTLTKQQNGKKYRATRQTHNPVDYARGNAEELTRLVELRFKK